MYIPIQLLSQTWYWSSSLPPKSSFLLLCRQYPPQNRPQTTQNIHLLSLWINLALTRVLYKWIDTMFTLFYQHFLLSITFLRFIHVVVYYDSLLFLFANSDQTYGCTIIGNCIAFIFGYNKQRGYERLCVSLCVDRCFHFSWVKIQNHNW